MNDPAPIHGTTSLPSGRKPRRYAPHRVCRAEECGTRLSIYNRRELCHLHAVPRYPLLRDGRIDRHTEISTDN